MCLFVLLVTAGSLVLRLMGVYAAGEVYVRFVLAVVVVGGLEGGVSGRER